LNTIRIEGKIVGENPVLKIAAGSGTSWTRFSVSDSRKDKKTDEWVTIFFNCSVFGETAEQVAMNLVKGDRVIVEGRLEENKYTTKDGVEKTSLNVIVSSVSKSMYVPKGDVGAPAGASVVSSDEDFF
jgi:single-strand DNA-binding protein